MAHPGAADDGDGQGCQNDQRCPDHRRLHWLAGLCPRPVSLSLAVAPGVLSRSKQVGIGVGGGSEGARCQRDAQNGKHGKDCLFHCLVLHHVLCRDRGLRCDFRHSRALRSGASTAWQDRNYRGRSVGEVSPCTSPAHFFWPLGWRYRVHCHVRSPPMRTSRNVTRIFETVPLGRLSTDDRKRRMHGARATWPKTFR
jgi:hypothetical protein